MTIVYMILLIGLTLAVWIFKEEMLDEFKNWIKKIRNNAGSNRKDSEYKDVTDPKKSWKYNAGGILEYRPDNRNSRNTNISDDTTT